MKMTSQHWGMIFFFVYLIPYAAFVLLNAFRPDLMEQTPISGINLAILSGFGLIIGAFLLALLYGFLCKPTAAPPSSPPRDS